LLAQPPLFWLLLVLQWWAWWYPTPLPPTCWSVGVVYPACDWLSGSAGCMFDRSTAGDWSNAGARPPCRKLPALLLAVVVAVVAVVAAEGTTWSGMVRGWGRGGA
jgi:hypothetical protein